YIFATENEIEKWQKIILQKTLRNRRLMSLKLSTMPLLAVISAQSMKTNWRDASRSRSGNPN
ncbi:MAG: hypothetical protein IKD78_00965, partial [Bacteroidales bacterium]|nr:hypothetical protein [Bacteroidales bacterium]